MSVTLSPIGGVAGQFFDNNGQPLSGGKIYTYAAGTTTPQACYTSAAGSTPHSNPIVLDSAGRVPGGEIWLTDSLLYKFVIETSTAILIGTYDNISGINSNFVNYTVQEEVQTATAGQTVFTLTTINYTPGTNSLSVYIDGVNQYVGTSYLETDSTTVTFTSGVHVGAEVKFTTAVQSTTSAVNASIVTYDPPFTGGVPTNVETKLSEYVSVKDFGAVGDGVTDDTAAIQAALNSGQTNIQLLNGVSVVNGTLTIPEGVCLYGASSASEYYPTGPGSTLIGSTLYKPNATGTSGPIVILQTGSSLRSCYLRHSKLNGATTGIIQIGLAGSHSVYNSNISDVRVYGEATTDLSGVNTCYGIYYPNGSVASSYQRYFNRAENFYVTNCDVGIRLGNNCNANTFGNFVIRQTYQHMLLDGIGAGEGCVENVFSGFACANIGVLPTSPVTVFTLKNYALFNSFSGYTTECNGSAFSIDATCAYNSFSGCENETGLSFVPSNNYHSKWAVPANRSGQAQILVPTVAAPQNYYTGTGNLIRFVQNISGTLPTLNGSGTLVASDPSSKVFARFNSTVYAKTARPAIKAKLTLFMGLSGGGSGESVATVEFVYRVTDNATNAASLSVLSVSQQPSSVNYIKGLKFLTGVAGSTGFGLAVVGGNIGAVTASQLVADLEILALTHDTNSVTMGDYADVTWGCTPATADDVTNAIDLLTVGNTSI